MSIKLCPSIKQPRGSKFNSPYLSLLELKGALSWMYLIFQWNLENTVLKIERSFAYLMHCISNNYQEVTLVPFCFCFFCADYISNDNLIVLSMALHTVTYHLFSVGLLTLLLSLYCMYCSFWQNIGVLVYLLCNKKFQRCCILILLFYLMQCT